MAKKAKSTKRKPSRAESPAVTAPAARPEAAAAKSGRQGYFFAAPVLLGFFMVCGGMAIIFAINWHTLSRLQRLAAAFMPVIAGFCCGVYSIVREKDQSWLEASAILSAAGFTVLTVLVAHIYDTREDMYDLYMIVMAAWLPLVYVLRSQALAAVYCAPFLFLMGLGPERGLKEEVLHCVAVTPFMFYYLFFHKPAGPRAVWMRYLCVIPLVYLISRFNIYRFDYLGMNFFAAAGLLYTAGLYYSEKGIGTWRNPWTVCGWFSLTALLFVTSSRLQHFLMLEQLYWDDEIPVYRYLSGLWLALFAAQLFFTARRPTPLKVAITLVTLMPIVCYLLKVPEQDVFLYGAVAFLLLDGVTLAEGIAGPGYMKANAGMAQITLLALTGWNIFGKSDLLLPAILVVTGAAFIAVNVYIGRKISGEKARVPAEGEA